MGNRGGNLPQKITFDKPIKDVTITKVMGPRPGMYVHVIQVIELEEVESIERKRFFKKIRTVNYIENKKTIPFSFKTYEDAKDFAQYIPGMSIWGERLYTKCEDNIHVIYYETYGIHVDGMPKNLYVKFTEFNPSVQYNCNIQDIYINDLDKLYQNGSKGNFFREDEIVVNYFFSKSMMNYTKKGNAEIMTFDEYRKLSDYVIMTKESTHKFVLMEETA